MIENLDGDVTNGSELITVRGKGQSSITSFFKILHEDGSSLEASAGGYPVFSNPAVGDLDGNPGNGLETVYAIGTTLYAYYSNTSLYWSSSLADNGYTPALADVNGDGSLEIAIGVGSSLYLFNNLGNILWSYPTAGTIRSSPAIGDIDGDGSLELVFISGDGKIYALENDKSPISPWPISVGTSGLQTYSSVALGDIDDDDVLEIVAGVSASSNIAKVVAYEVSGSNIFQKTIINSNFCGSIDSSVALGDLNGDGHLEMVIGVNCGANIHALDDTGNYLSGWPVSLPSAPAKSAPVLADVDGDSEIEVLVVTGGPRLSIIEPNGAVLYTTILRGNYDTVYSSPAVAAAKNGKVLIGAVTKGNPGYAYLLDTTGDYDAQYTPWPMYHGDAKNTGVHLPLARIVSPSNGTMFNQALNVTFNGNGLTFDLPLDYQWSSDLEGVFGNSKTVTTNSLRLGVHKIWLRVTDQKGRYDDSNGITVTITNAPPAATIISPVDGTSFTKGDLISFNASAADSDGVIVSYNWTSSFSGYLSSLPHFQTTLPVGRHIISITVKDSDGASTSENVNILVKPSNYTATWNISKLFMMGAVVPIRFAITDSSDGSIIHDNTARISVYNPFNNSIFSTSNMVWDGSEHLVNYNSPSNLLQGVYTVRLTSEIAPPGFQFETQAFTSVFYSGKNVVFNAEQLFGGENFVIYTWDWGDGSGGTGSLKSHIYTAPGTYFVSFTGTYSNGSIYSDELRIGVNLAGDVNSDTIVDILDLTTIGLYWNKVETDPDFDPRIDITGDGIIDISDASEVGFNWT